MKNIKENLITLIVVKRRKRRFVVDEYLETKLNILLRDMEGRIGLLEECPVPRDGDRVILLNLFTFFYMVPDRLFEKGGSRKELIVELGTWSWVMEMLASKGRDSREKEIQEFFVSACDFLLSLARILPPGDRIYFHYSYLFLVAHGFPCQEYFDHHIVLAEEDECIRLLSEGEMDGIGNRFPFRIIDYIAEGCLTYVPTREGDFFKDDIHLKKCWERAGGYLPLDFFG